MKVSLVVASGAHQGKVIPVVGAQFVIGRDPQCHLRPASQAVSKQHCAIVIREGVVSLKDFGSTNGSVLNDTIVKGEERELKNNDSVKVGPLDFTIRIEESTVPVDGTPLPDMNPETTAALAAVKAVASGTVPTTSARNATPAPKAPARPNPVTKSGSKESPALKAGSKESPALKAGSKESPALPATSPAQAEGHDDNDRLAAMLLGLDDEEVPGGNTVVDMPVIDLKEAEAKAAAEKKPVVKEDSSNAASELLRKYMRRPK
jgi:pSer/pThr/pTyr-binding forkhead associated (FHA) protein